MNFTNQLCNISNYFVLTENLEKQQQKIEKELGTLDWINEINKISKTK